MATHIVVPEMGESVVDARIARWLKREGERVEAGEALVELETEKIDVEVSAPKPGVLARIARREGEDVKIGEVIGLIEEEAAGRAAAEPRQAPAEPEAPPA
ncbi:MAG TPA: biotin/lipoyl-containing protein, partial [Vicinamibacterales bacterium]|nr:biotin/lipoyl-containing protein [Vicinamibacterales bacterium]